MPHERTGTATPEENERVPVEAPKDWRVVNLMPVAGMRAALAAWGNGF